MSGDDLVLEWLGGRFTRIHRPQYALVTPEPVCNLACRHCYWPHDLHAVGSRDWTAQIDQLIDWDAYIVVAGRVITPRTMTFIEQYWERAGRRFGIVDNGTTILKHPELWHRCEPIEISIDGNAAQHDLQRGKEGSFEAAWEAVMALRDAGFDPIISACLSKITWEGWGELEARLAEHQLRLSTTPIAPARETLERNPEAHFGDDELPEVLAMLVEGTAKVVHLYSYHMPTLVPQLARYRWRAHSGGLQAELPNGVVLRYTPTSVMAQSGRDLLWDGQFHNPERVTRGDRESGERGGFSLDELNEMCRREHEQFAIDVAPLEPARVGPTPSLA